MWVQQLVISRILSTRGHDNWLPRTTQHHLVYLCCAFCCAHSFHSCLDFLCYSHNLLQFTRGIMQIYRNFLVWWVPNLIRILFLVFNTKEHLNEIQNWNCFSTVINLFACISWIYGNLRVSTSEINIKCDVFPQRIHHVGAFFVLFFLFKDWNKVMFFVLPKIVFLGKNWMDVGRNNVVGSGIVSISVFNWCICFLLSSLWNVLWLRAVENRAYVFVGRNRWV